MGPLFATAGMSPAPPSKTAAIYARVSTDDQTKGYSLPTQLEHCRRYAAEHGYDVVAEFTEDYSGATMDRPELDKLRRLLATGRLQVVVVYELDRLARKTVYQMLIEEEFAKGGAPVEYVLGGYMDTPEGQLQKQIRGAVAEFEREKIKERTLRGKRGRAQAGFVLVGAMEPYGYRYVKGDRQGWLEVVEDEAALVRLIYRWYTLGDDTGKRLGQAAIAHRLSTLGRPTKRASGPLAKLTKTATTWSRSTVGHILRSEVYAGVWYYGRTRRTGKSTFTARDRSEWIAVDVPAIIDRAMWDAAQVQVTDNRIHSPRNTRRAYLLQGRLTCATCGHAFQAFTDARQASARGYYYCGGQKLTNAPDYATKACRRSVRQDAVDSQVWEHVKAVLKRPEMILEALREQRTEVDQELASVRTWLASVEAKIAGLDRQRQKVLDLFLDEAAGMPRDLLSAKTAEIAAERARLEREARELRQRIEQSAISDTDVEQVKRFCDLAQEGLDLFTFEDQASTIAALNIRGQVQRGPTREQDRIILTGYLPALPDTDVSVARTIC